jgi:hypothetical protein
MWTGIAVWCGLNIALGAWRVYVTSSIEKPVVCSELVCATVDDMQGILPNRHLKRRRLVPRRPHPDIEFLFRRHDRISHGMARHDDGSESDCQEPGQQETPRRDRLRPWSAFS